MLHFFLVMCFKIMCFLIVLAMKQDQVFAQQFNNPATDLSRHKIAQATVIHARTKRELTSTRRSEGLHHPEVLIKIIMDNEEYVLDLRLNEDLISEDHVISYQADDGKTVQHKPSIEELDICQYSGVVRDKPDSWAAVSTCRGVRGVIYDGQRMKHIQPDEGGEIGSNHFIYDHLDLNVTHKCGFDAGAITNNTNYDLDLLELNQHDMNNTRYKRHKREAFDAAEPRGPYKSNYFSRYVELVLVADHRFYKSQGKDINKVHNRMRDLTNIIYSMYTPLNIFITLVGVKVWNIRDEMRISSDSLVTLENFLEYRRTRLEIKNDNAHLITMQRFDEGVVGKGHEGVMCTYKSSGGIASHDRDSDIQSLAFTITHEMGHNFGMSHDEESCKCVDEHCIMVFKVTRMIPTHWSSCSIRSLTRAFDRGAEYCLRNKPKRLFLSPTCGNGFVEYGEQCDCGRPATRAERKACRSCCDPRTCRFRSYATCASGECCNLKTCRPMSAGTVCRSALKVCDLPEHCTGHSEFCPADVFKMDATPCGTHQEAYCVGGSCKSHSTQCRLLWGPTSNNSHPKCYSTYNPKGNIHGNCGYDKERNRYEACSFEDVLCGRLQCQRLERLQIGHNNHADEKAMFETDKGKLLQCNTAHVDLGLNDVDPGLVPDGANCGNDKICFKQRCRPLAEIRAGIAVCPNDCNGRGVCNSKGHCHCNPGFAPPDCAVPGPGGSYDSGPTTKSKETIVDDSTNVEPTPHPKRPDYTTKPKDPKLDGPTNIWPDPRSDRPDDTTKPEDRKPNEPTNVKPVPRPKGSGDTTEFNNSDGVSPTTVKPAPQPDGLDDIESEVVTDPNAHRNLMVAIYVIFLGVMPLILLVLFVIYFKKLKNICCSNETPSLDHLQRRASSNCNSFFSKFPRIAVDASSHRVFFNYNNTVMNARVS